MSFAATTRASVYRGTTTNPLGDDVDDNTTPVLGLEDIRASLIERMRTVMDPASGERRTVRYCVGRLSPDVVIAQGDRIRDNVTGHLYALDEFTLTPRTIGGQSALVLDLRIL